MLYTLCTIGETPVKAWAGMEFTQAAKKNNAQFM